MILFLKEMGALDWSMVVLWGVIFIVSLGIELETANLTTIWFVISAAITSILAFILSPLWQIIIFVVLSLVLVLATRPLVKKRMRGKVVRTNSDRVIGLIGIVTKEIVPNEIGEVKVANELWRAINNEGLSFTVGESVVINAITGIKLVVSKVGDDNTVQIIKNN